MNEGVLIRDLHPGDRVFDTVSGKEAIVGRVRFRRVRKAFCTITFEDDLRVYRRGNGQLRIIRRSASALAELNGFRWSSGRVVEDGGFEIR